MANKTVRSESIVNSTGRIIVVGDLHGCYAETIELLDQLQVTSCDTVIFCGDLVDRGPENKKCIFSTSA